MSWFYRETAETRIAMFLDQVRIDQIRQHNRTSYVASRIDILMGTTDPKDAAKLIVGLLQQELTPAEIETIDRILEISGMYFTLITNRKGK